LPPVETLNISSRFVFPLRGPLTQLLVISTYVRTRYKGQSLTGNKR